MGIPCLIDESRFFVYLVKYVYLIFIIKTGAIMIRK